MYTVLSATGTFPVDPPLKTRRDFPLTLVEVWKVRGDGGEPVVLTAHHWPKAEGERKCVCVGGKGGGRKREREWSRVKGYVRLHIVSYRYMFCTSM